MPEYDDLYGVAIGSQHIYVFQVANYKSHKLLDANNKAVTYLSQFRGIIKVKELGGQ